MSWSTTRAAWITATAAAFAIAIAGTAHAVPDTMYAPHAQAAARISDEGAILASKGIDTVTGPQTNGRGAYCITFTDPDLELTDSAPQVTVEADSGTATMHTTPHRFCNNAENTLTVFTRNTGGTRTNLAFAVAIP
ncbi:hypothetical protein ACWGH5_39270 [Streptomyces sp. NPDC054864]